VRLFSTGNIASEKDYARRLQPCEQGTETRGHFSSVEADNKQLADLTGDWAGYLQSTCFFNSANRFKASSGVKRFKSTSRSFSKTGCDSGVKIVN
jgi:hypothetical protein